MALINFSGIASGIDTAGLIKAYLDQQRASRITPLETRRTEYQDTNDSFSQLKTLLNNLSDAAQQFRSLNGGGIRKQSTSSDETVITAEASNSAQNGTYNLTVTQRAKSATYSYDDRFADTSTVINSSINNGAAAANRTVTYSIGSGAGAETVSVVLTSSTTAEDFVTQFNSQSAAASASLVNVGTSSSPSYAIVINSNSEGTSAGTITQTSIGSELAAGSGALQTATVSQATDATFTVSGVSGTITRSSNIVSDVIAGVTLSIQSLGTSQVTVTSDASGTADAIQSLVDAYNEIVTYISDKDRITQEQESNGQTKNIFGTLSNTSIDENTLSALRNALTNASISGGIINTLADLGVTTQRDGTLAFDSDTFVDGLNSDPASGETILSDLAESLGAVDGIVAQFTRFNGLIDTAINANSNAISALNRNIADVEKTLSQREQALTNQYSRLEGLIGQLNSQQSLLTSLLPR